jgi:flavin reductase (DIM6/NTAB) family NADH-FMN oxidoreductase RutF
MDYNQLTEYFHSIPHLLNQITGKGLLLVTGSKSGRHNCMTIGWVRFGYGWRIPVVDIMIRPSRFSYGLLQSHNEFTLNAMPDNCGDAVVFCGAHSGSHCDKFQETGLLTTPSSEIETPGLMGAQVVLECRIIHKVMINPSSMNDLILARYYASGDYHQMITAEIKHCSNRM